MNKIFNKLFLGLAVCGLAMTACSDGVEWEPSPVPTEGQRVPSVKMAKKEMMTVAMATIPKSSGESSRARIPATTSEIMIPLYLAMAV